MKYLKTSFFTCSAMAVLIASSSFSLEVSTARDNRDNATPFQIKLETLQAAMEAAYNDLLDKHNALQNEMNLVKACSASEAVYLGVGAAGANAGGCKAIPTVPANTVAAFTTATCPTGWSTYTDANGRFIIGSAGSYTMGKKAGASSVALSTGHMPRHRHSFTDRYTKWKSRAKPESWKGSSNDLFMQMENNGTNTSYEGNGSAFSIIPPYVALRFCIKN